MMRDRAGAAPADGMKANDATDRRASCQRLDPWRDAAVISNPKCSHLNFRSEVEVARLERHEGGEVRDYLAGIRITCADCGRPFRFVDQRFGLSLNEPTASVDRLELRVPIEPTERSTESLRSL
jgi:hypothetical protein